MMVDLRSDTVTKPTPGMRAAMANAEVGDDVFGEDPTVNALEARVARMLGKQEGLFVPTGTMANQIAIRCETEPGDEILLEADAHPFHYEAGAAAVISGVTIRLLQGDRGVLQPDVVRDAVRAPNVHHAPARLFCVENTANRGGGTVIPAEHVAKLCAVARDAGLSCHLDGARLWNAVAAPGAEIARALLAQCDPFDTVSVCFSKGLGAPVGSMLVGPSRLMGRARRFRKMLGGGMRQVGILAAACDYALDHHLPGLLDDSTRARRLWEGLGAQGWEVERAPQSNMVYFRTPNAPNLAGRMDARGVRCLALGWDRIRLVTHLDVDDAGIQLALDAFAAEHAEPSPGAP
ncbi:MAG: aminotransferase class I/II-fold pyridoxal phosphate-dependent enzyme [Myxococcales bacterium]|nr:aminotransferase class I/II-fold pyridoxal phosphate-dependent enzyme [Myxococcales bacterium]